MQKHNEIIINLLMVVGVFWT